ncbi:hypothetical protein niasHT_022913 [Heterodera trifolii]|uniref:Uncharacterized protein n=1 Tax=Heterodera trifolii TaxID=157864 RepID=A0ABD2IWQ3_9BILA
MPSTRQQQLNMRKMSSVAAPPQCFCLLMPAPSQQKMTADPRKWGTNGWHSSTGRPNNLQRNLHRPTRAMDRTDCQYLNIFVNPHKKSVFVNSPNVQANPSVKALLDLFHLMPLNRPARISFVDHFHLRLENQAKALIAYMRDLSAPSPNDKRSALNSKWHLITVRRNLNLLSTRRLALCWPVPKV